MSNQLQIRQRVFEDGIGERAIDPQRFAIRRHSDPMGGNRCSAFRDSESAGFVGQLDLCRLLATSEVDHRESMESLQLDEYPAGRSIGIRLKGHGPNSTFKFNGPGCLPGVKVDDRDGFVFDGAADCISAVGCDVNVVHRPVDGDGFHTLQQIGIDDIDQPRLCANADYDAASIFRNGDVIGVTAELYLMQNVAANSIDYVEHTLSFVADVDS